MRKRKKQTVRDTTREGQREREREEHRVRGGGGCRESQAV